MSEQVTRPLPQVSVVEFVAMMALMMALVAFSTDAMLPAFPQMAQALSPMAHNRVQLVVTLFLLGLGLGMIFAGPLSDHFGRKPVLLGGTLVYMMGALLCWRAGSLELLLVGRVIQGIGASATRTVSVAMVRDLYSGRQMAQITSFIMMVFTIFPAMAPTFGEAVMAHADWRFIFVALIGVAVAGTGWFGLRQGETLTPERRIPFRFGSILTRARGILSMRLVVIMMAVQAFAAGTLFATLSSIQQIFDVTFGRAEQFHLWFAGIGVLSGCSGAINAMVVKRLGMRFMILLMLHAQIIMSGLAAILLGFGLLPLGGQFAVFLVFALGVFFQIGLLVGNATALAMEPLGAQAGLAASVMGSIGTLVAVLLAIPIGLAFDGTPMPLVLGALCLAILSRSGMYLLPPREVA